MAVASSSWYLQLEAHNTLSVCSGGSSRAAPGRAASLGGPAFQPVMLHLSHVVSSSVDILTLCSHICPLPRGGQFGSGDSVVGETWSANSLPLGAGVRSQFCGSLQSSAQDQCCGGGDKDARELGTLLPLEAPARPLEGAPAARVAGTQFTLADPCSVPRGSVERSTVSS